MLYQRTEYVCMLSCCLNARIIAFIRLFFPADFVFRSWSTGELLSPWLLSYVKGKLLSFTSEDLLPCIHQVLSDIVLICHQTICLLRLHHSQVYVWSELSRSSWQDRIRRVWNCLGQRPVGDKEEEVSREEPLSYSSYSCEEQGERN